MLDWAHQLHKQWAGAQAGGAEVGRAMRKDPGLGKWQKAGWEDGTFQDWTVPLNMPKSNLWPSLEKQLSFSEVTRVGPNPLDMIYTEEESYEDSAKIPRPRDVWRHRPTDDYISASQPSECEKTAFCCAGQSHLHAVLPLWGTAGLRNQYSMAVTEGFSRYLYPGTVVPTSTSAFFKQGQ